VPTIRERAGQFHAQVRMSGFPTRTASFPTRRMAERWAKTVEADMIEGRHFRSVEARRRTLAEVAFPRFSAQVKLRTTDLLKRIKHRHVKAREVAHISRDDG
jgi:hypothetical protein